MNVTTWADSLDTVRAKLSAYLESFNWHLISIEKAQPIDEHLDYGAEVAEMIERTRENPDAIIWTFLHLQRKLTSAGGWPTLPHYPNEAVEFTGAGPCGFCRVRV